MTARLTRRGRRGLAVALAGELLLVLGLAAALFAGYELWGKPAQVQEIQQHLDDRLTDSWRAATSGGRAAGDSSTQEASESPAVAGGEPFARLALPVLGLRWVVVEGVSASDLRGGPGHYPGTARPGEVGNFAVAGHRSPGVFWDLDRLAAGDTVLVETAHGWFTYRVYDTLIVRPTDTYVIAPDPSIEDGERDRRLLTLTTCNPRWGNWERLVVHAELIDPL